MSNALEGKQIMVQGRVVWTVGKSIFEAKAKLDQNTKQPRMNKLGQPMMEFGFGLAVPKNVPGATVQPIAEIWNAMHEVAFQLYPARQLPPAFAMKYKDGDQVNHQGQPYPKEHKGHLVFACTTTIAPKFFRHDGTNYVMINEGIQCGDYVQVQLTIKAHLAHGQGKPGLYLNPNSVLFIGHGEPIINTPSGEAIWGQQAPAMYPGSSATPIAPAGFQGVPQAPQPYAQPAGFAPPGAPPQQFQPPQAPQPQPHYGVLPQQFQPPQAPQPQPQVQPYNPMQAPQPPQQYVPAVAPAQAMPSFPMSSGTPAGFAQPAYPSNPQQYQQPGQQPTAPQGMPSMPFPGQR